MSNALRRLLDHTLSRSWADREAFLKDAAEAQTAEKAWEEWRQSGVTALSDDDVSPVAGGSRPKGGFC